MSEMSEIKVPFFDYPRVYLDDRDNLLSIIDEVCSRGAFILQDDLYNFEHELANYLDIDQAVGVGNATDGMELAWLAVGLQPGDEVICCAHTMLATASAIVMAGGVPVPVDIGDDNLIDPEAIEDAITPRTIGIMPTQLNGRICDMDKICATAEKNDLVLIEDAAQALGARYKGRSAGSFGLAGSFSFFPAKVMGCLGDGGAVVSNDSEIFERIFQLHDHGRAKNGEVHCWGRNSRLDNLQAAILRYRLTHYTDVIARRREIARIYQEQLCDIEMLRLPPGPYADPERFDVYQNYELCAQRRDQLQAHLKQRGVGTLVQWNGRAVHQWEALGYDMRIPRVEKFFNESLMLPMNMFVSDSDIEYVCESVRSFYGVCGS